MAHRRKEIRDRVITALTGLTTTGSNVFATKVHPLSANSLPGLCVYTSKEENEYTTSKPPRNIKHELTVNVDIYVDIVTNYENTIDQIAVEIESALYADRTLNGNANDLRLVGLSTEYNDEGASPLGIMSLATQITYFTQEGTPDPS